MTDTTAWNFQSTRKRRRRRKKEARDFHLGPTICMTLLPVLSLLAGAPIAFIDAATPASQPTAYNDQTANLVAFAAKVIKTSQTSGCDGEQLQISCPPDYTIAIITADLTILAPAHQQQPAMAGTNQSSADATPGNQCAPTTTGVATNGVESQQQQPQLAAATGSGLQQAAADTLGGASHVNLTTSAWCDASAANVSARTNQQLVLDAVRTSCQQRVGSCQLSLAPEPSAAAPSVGTQKSLGRLLQESCPHNRKLIEVAYKCRAQKFTRRTVCRGDKMRLDCPLDKRIAILSGLYGSLPAETKINERCLSSSVEDFNGANSQQLAAVSSPLVVSNTSMYKACGTQNDTLKTLMLKCAGFTRCSLDVTPQVFGETNCSLGQPEYVMFHFLCVPNNLMRPDWLRNDSLVSAATGVVKSRDSSPPILTGNPSNPSSWSLNPNPIGSPSSTSGRNGLNSGADVDVVQTSPAFTTVVSSGDPQATLGAKNDHKRTQDRSVGDNLHHWIQSFQQEIVLYASCGLLVFVVSLFLTRKLISHGHSRRHTNLSVSSKNSANSTCSNSAASTHSSHSPPMATAHAHMNHYHTHHPHLLVPHPRHAQQQQPGASHQSCFSLDELQAVGGGHSPAASGTDTPSADGNSGTQLVPPTYHTAAGTMAAGGLQPRLWSIYHGRQQQQSLNASGTLRPTRTFLGAQQPQPPQPPQLFQHQQQHSQHHHQHQCLLQHQTLGWNNQQQQQQPCAQINAGAQLELQLLQANTGATTQCAFHQQQHQLHQQFLQQPIVLAPPELEPTIGEGAGEQQQQQSTAPYLTLSATQATSGQFQPQQPVLYQQQQQQQ